MAGRIFERGVPYAEALERLDKAFPNSKDGDLFAHDELEKIIGEPRRSQRYRGVLTAWRKHLRRRGYWPTGRGRAQGVGVALCTPQERQAEGVEYAFKAQKSSKIAVLAIEGVDTASYDAKEKIDYDRARTEILTVHAVADAAVKRMLPPPVKPPPRLATPDQLALAEKPAPASRSVPPAVQGNVRLMKLTAPQTDSPTPPDPPPPAS